MVNTACEKTFSVAPMMEWTDRHCRFFHRILSRRAILYTEMVTSAAVIHGDRERLLGFSPEEHPVICQIGGSDPAEMAEAARIVAECGYDAVNINVGCPSDRVQKGRFGAILMKEPRTVAACASAMLDAVDIPVTVKCRVGVDEMDEDADLDRFIDIVADAGVRTFVIHARKAWLKGLSPKENREKPPLNRERVYRLKERRPDLEIIINGELDGIDVLRAQLERVDGVMTGRGASCAGGRGPLRRAGTGRLARGGGGAFHSLCGAGVGTRRAPQCHDQTHAGHLPRAARCPSLSPSSLRERDEARGRRGSAPAGPGSGA